MNEWMKHPAEWQVEHQGFRDEVWRQEALDRAQRLLAPAIVPPALEISPSTNWKCLLETDHASDLLYNAFGKPIRPKPLKTFVVTSPTDDHSRDVGGVAYFNFDTYRVIDRWVGERIEPFVVSNPPYVIGSDVADSCIPGIEARFRDEFGIEGDLGSFGYLGEPLKSYDIDDVTIETALLDLRQGLSREFAFSTSHKGLKGLHRRVTEIATRYLPACTDYIDDFAAWSLELVADFVRIFDPRSLTTTLERVCAPARKQSTLEIDKRRQVTPRRRLIFETGVTSDDIEDTNYLCNWSNENSVNLICRRSRCRDGFVEESN